MGKNITDIKTKRHVLQICQIHAERKFIIKNLDRLDKRQQKIKNKDKELVIN